MIKNVRGVELIIDAWDDDVNIKSVLLLNCFNMMQRMILMITYIYEERVGVILPQDDRDSNVK